MLTLKVSRREGLDSKELVSMFIFKTNCWKPSLYHLVYERMGSFSIAVALIWAIIAVPASRWSCVDASSTVNCTGSCNIVAASLAGEVVGLADISRMCEGVCAAVDAQSGTSCGEALLGSPPEHLVLLAYSSGHVLESAAILLGAALNASEDAAFIASLHLNDRGSPAGCANIDDAHYCLGQIPHVASLGLCLPTSCDSASVMTLVGNLTSMLSNDTSSSSSFAAAVAGIGEASFTCGNELRLGVDAGTVIVFCLIGALVALAVVGTASDYYRRQTRKHVKSENAQRKRQVLGIEGCHVMHVSTTPSAGTRSESLLLPNSSHIDEGQNIGVQLDRGEIGISKFNEDHSREPLLLSEQPAAEAGQYSFLSDRMEGRVEGDEDEGISGPPHNNRVDGRVEWWIECLECFSLIKNTDKLLAPPRPGDEFPALEGVRALSILWVLLGHTVVYTFMYGAGYTNVNDILPQDGSGFLARLTAQAIPGGFLSVDTFFLMSGFLVSCVLLPKLKTVSPGRYLWIAKAYLHRYLRLTPTLAFVVLMTWKILPFFGEGPTWWSTMVSQEKSCSKYWWVEVTYLSNVLPWPPHSDVCIDVSWYLANDTQFFVVAVLLVTLFHRRPRLGTVVALLMLAASCLHTLLWIGFHKGVRFSALAGSEDWSEVYCEPWSRCPPYLIGLLCGFLWHAEVRGRLCDAKKEDLTSGRDDSATNPTGSTPQERLMDTKVTVFVAVASAALLAVPVYGSYWAYQDTVESQMPAWADHLYLAFSRPAWALGVAGMCALCFTGSGGMVNWILTWPAWVTLSRLTYCAYLTHPLLLTWLYGVRLTPVEFTSLEYAVTFMGCAVGTFTGATVLHMFVEAPFRNLESWARKRGGAKDSM